MNFRDYLMKVILLCMYLASSALAGDERAHTPPQSPFRAVGPEILEQTSGATEYEGRATITAKYRFVFDEENGYSKNPYLFLMPSEDGQAELPYVTRWVHESNDAPKLVQWTERAEKIWVTNVTEAATALLGKQLAEEVLAGKHEKVTGEAIVVIEGFIAGYECDNPSFATRLVEVKKEISAAAMGKRDFGGC